MTLMNNMLSSLKKTVITLALLLAATAGAYAQTTWSGIVSFTTNQTITNNVTLSDNAILRISSGVTVTVTGSIRGSFGLGVTGGGTLIMAGNNTYRGITSVAGSTLQIGNGKSGSNDETLGIRLDESSTLRFYPEEDMVF